MVVGFFCLLIIGMLLRWQSSFGDVLVIGKQKDLMIIVNVLVVVVVGWVLGIIFDVIGIGIKIYGFELFVFILLFVFIVKKLFKVVI